MVGTHVQCSAEWCIHNKGGVCQKGVLTILYKTGIDNPYCDDSEELKEHMTPYEPKP